VTEALARGETVGRFVVLELKGRGGMGVVYAAWDPQLDRRVALKLVRPDRSSAGARARLLREAQTMARLAHPNVITVYEAGEWRDQVFLAMELAEGPTLARWLRAERRSWRAIRDMFVAVGRGLAAAHAAGLVHRDFKPDNALVTPHGVPKVTDFGLAKLLGDPEAPGGASPPSSEAYTQEAYMPISPKAPLTQDGVVFGTPRYMAPEQLEGLADPRADQFAFCRAFEEALSQEQPSEAVAVVSTVDVDAPPQRVPMVARADVPRWLRAVLQRGMAERPDDRWPSMDELLAALSRDPGANLRRVGLAAGALALAAGAGVLATRLAAAPASPCAPAAAEARLSGIWDPPTRVRMTAAFRATQLPYADRVLETAAARLDGWAAGWREMRTEVCAATHVRHEQSPELLDLRMACLDARREELGALVQIFVAADAKTVETAVQAAHKLSSLTACADARALSGMTPPPPDERVQTVRTQIAAAKALGDAGRLSDARKLAAKALAGAREIGWRPLVADALLREAYAMGAAGEDPAQALREALSAAESSRHDRAVAEAWVQLVYTVILGRADDARADEWAERAASALERIGGDWDLEARLALNYGAVAYQRGHYLGALARWERAREIWDRQLPPEHPDRARVDNNLGIVLDSLGKLDEAEVHYRRAIAIWERALGPHHPLVASGLSNLGSLLRTRGQLDEAISTLRRAVAILEVTVPPDHPSLGDPLQNLANALLAKNQVAEARPLYERILALREKRWGPDHPQVADVLVSLATTARAERDLPRALALAERAVAIQQAKSGADHPSTAIALTALGEVRLSRGEYAAAVPPLTTALHIFEAKQGAAHPTTAYALSALGRAYLGVRQPARALPLLERAVAIRQQSPEKQPLAESRLALAQALRATRGDAARARTLEAAARPDLSGPLDPDQLR